MRCSPYFLLCLEWIYRGGKNDKYMTHYNKISVLMPFSLIEERKENVVFQHSPFCTHSRLFQLFLQLTRTQHRLHLDIAIFDVLNHHCFIDRVAVSVKRNLPAGSLDGLSALDVG